KGAEEGSAGQQVVPWGGQAGTAAALVPRLLPVAPAAMPGAQWYQVSAQPRGSFANLVPGAVDAAAAAAAMQPGEMLLAVTAVGLNFRDVLNVLGMYPGDPGNPGSD
ncbi:type I polyketide synthase, partial [Haematococcus lacustris]